LHLVVMRHGDAQRGGACADADRPLLQVGERQAARAGQAFRQLGMRPASLWTSPALRCRRTGEIVAAALGMDAHRVDVREELAAGSGAARILPALLQAAQGTVRHPWWIVVGHQPDLEELLQHLLVGAHHLRLFLPPGGSACVEFTRPGLQPPARLRWALTPEWVELAAAGARSASRADDSPAPEDAAESDDAW